jgi:NADH-quinone oxidoreductase subunit C
MSEETKSASPPPPEGEKKAAPQPPATGQTSVAPTPAKPPAAAPPAKAAGGGEAAKPAVPAKPAGPTPQPWEPELVTRLRRVYGSGIAEASAYLGQNYMVVDSSIAHEFLQVLRDQEQFDYCVDVTAVHYPAREKQFEVVYVLYSFPLNQRIRVKTQIAEGASLPSVVGLWPTADWLEREVFDMFGIKFDGHPGLKRILLPEGWKGYPLRKDYGIIQQDNEWVQINLGIESGQ